eukprot:1668512-Prymnesium_polylepis.1
MHVTKDRHLARERLVPKPPWCRVGLSSMPSGGIAHAGETAAADRLAGSVASPSTGHAAGSGSEHGAAHATHACDNERGRIYFFHETSRESQWDRPTASNTTGAAEGESSNDGLRGRLVRLSGALVQCGAMRRRLPFRSSATYGRRPPR